MSSLYLTHCAVCFCFPHLTIALISPFTPLPLPSDHFHNLFPKQTELQKHSINHCRRAVNEFRQHPKLWQRTSSMQLEILSCTGPWSSSTIVLTKERREKVRPQIIHTPTQCFSQTPAQEGEWRVRHVHPSHLNAKQWAGYNPKLKFSSNKQGDRISQQNTELNKELGFWASGLLGFGLEKEKTNRTSAACSYIILLLLKCWSKSVNQYQISTRCWNIDTTPLKNQASPSQRDSSSAVHRHPDTSHHIHSNMNICENLSSNPFENCLDAAVWAICVLFSSKTFHNMKT